MKRAVGLVIVLLTSSAQAYPTSVIFAPTGDSEVFGQVGLLAYSALNLNPSVGRGTAWTGLEAGVLPSFQYGSLPIRFGGLEVGIDALSSWAYPNEAAYVKPVLNVKTSILAEDQWWPSVAVGAMQLAFVGRHSVNLLYASATRSLNFGPDLGRVTAGCGYAAQNDRNVFNGQPTFNWPGALILGYESPSWWHLRFAIDHIGGTSEVSSTYAALILNPLEGVDVAAGGYVSSNRQNPQDGLHVYTTLAFDIRNIERPD